MITEPRFYVVCVDEQAFLSANRRFWIRPYHPRNPGGYTPTSIGLFTGEEAASLASRPPKAEQRPSAPVSVMAAPRCACCGADEHRAQMFRFRGGIWRCVKHKDRNPCVADGCQRTRAANGHPSNESHICGDHWKRYVPPRSPERRAILRLVRLAKKAGYRRTDRWSDDLEARYWRTWRGVVRRVRARSTAGHLDEAAINRMFGWD